MSDQESGDGQIKQRMDALLLRVLKTPPQSRAEVAELARRAKAEAKATRTRGKRASAGKRGPRTVGEEFGQQKAVILSALALPAADQNHRKRCTAPAPERGSDVCPYRPRPRPAARGPCPCTFRTGYRSSLTPCGMNRGSLGKRRRVAQSPTPHAHPGLARSSPRPNQARC